MTHRPNSVLYCPKYKCQGRITSISEASLTDISLPVPPKTNKCVCVLYTLPCCSRASRPRTFSRWMPWCQWGAPSGYGVHGGHFPGCFMVCSDELNSLQLLHIGATPTLPPRRKARATLHVKHPKHYSMANESCGVPGGTWSSWAFTSTSPGLSWRYSQLCSNCEWHTRRRDYTQRKRLLSQQT